MNTDIHLRAHIAKEGQMIIMKDDVVGRQAAIDALNKNRDSVFHDSVHYEDAVYDISNLPSAQPEPAIPLQWIEAQIEWLKSLDNAFSNLTALQISAMVNYWKDEQDG